MILGKSDIQNKIDNNQMIIDYTPDCIKNCSYKIRVGKLIEAGTGRIIDLQSKEPYLLGPSKVVIFQSIEKIKLPENITVSYSALYSIASKGILLINSSMIEPKYSGALSGVLLNFSSRAIAITKNCEVAKLNFYEVSGNTNDLEEEKIAEDKYLCRLIEKATSNYHKSFLNISDLEKTIESNILGKIKGLLTTSGIVLFFLITFATLEPLFSRWFWEKTGIPTTSEQIQLEKVLTEIKESQNKTTQLKELQIQIDSLKQNIKSKNDKK